MEQRMHTIENGIETTPPTPLCQPHKGRRREAVLQEQLAHEAALRNDLAMQCAQQLQQLQQEVALLRATLQVMQSNAMVGTQRLHGSLLSMHGVVVFERFREFAHC